MSNTKIRFKRSSAYGTSNATLSGDKLLFGEPLLIDTSENNIKEQYLVLGPTSEGGETVNNSIFFKGLSLDQAKHGVSWKTIQEEIDGSTTGSFIPYVVDQTDYTTPVETYKVICKDTKTKVNANDTDKYYILCRDKDRNVVRFKFDTADNDVGIYVDGRGVMHGAAWNDYAENRDYESSEVNLDSLYGKVVCEDGSGHLTLSKERLQPCAYVVSDTYGHIIGEGNLPVAVSGRVLVYTEDKVALGDCVTAGPNGKAVKMSRQEIINYPDRILGTVLEVPDYDKFNDKKINDRVWIRVK